MTISRMKILDLDELAKDWDCSWINGKCKNEGSHAGWVGQGRKLLLAVPKSPGMKIPTPDGLAKDLNSSWYNENIQDQDSQPG